MKINAKLLEKAIAFSAKAHEGQVRKGDGKPYILHPFALVFRLGKIKKSKNPFLTAICALLHDSVEDNENITIELIAQEFGFQVASIVGELTSDKAEIARIGKKHYLLYKMQNMSSYALRIKLIDRWDNVDDLVDMPADFQQNAKEETLFILEGLKERKLTRTHLKIIKEIHKILKNY